MATTNLAIFPWTVSMAPVPQKLRHKRTLTAVAVTQPIQIFEGCDDWVPVAAPGS